MRRTAATATFEFAPAGPAGAYRLTGVLGFETAAAVLARGQAAFRGQAEVAIDLGGVTHADSAGLAVLLAWVERARHDGRALSYSSLPEQLVRIARLCAVEEMLGGASGTAGR